MSAHGRTVTAPAMLEPKRSGPDDKDGEQAALDLLASGKLEIEFEDEDETRFVISPNAPVRQIWISALTTSFKLGWSETAQAFVLEKTGETLSQVMSRILTEKIGSSVKV